MTRTRVAAVVVTLALSLSPPGGLGPRRAGAQFVVSPGAAQAAADNIEGLTVSGRGAVSARPSRLEIDVEISSASELTADAIVKYRDAKKRLREAFDALKLENVAVEERGLLVDEKGAQVSPYFFDGMPSRKAKAEVQLSRKLVIVCKGIRGMDEEAVLQLVARLLDVAQDAGGRVGGGQDFNPYYYNPYNRTNKGLVRFVLDDFEALEEQAFGKAVADAEAKARRLAKLSKVELGTVAGLRVTASPGDRPAASNAIGMPAEEPAGDRPDARREIESPRFEEIPVRVELVIRYGVAAPRDERRAEGR